MAVQLGAFDAPRESAEPSLTTAQRSLPNRLGYVRRHVRRRTRRIGALQSSHNAEYLSPSHFTLSRSGRCRPMLQSTNRLISELI